MRRLKASKGVTYFADLPLGTGPVRSCSFLYDRISDRCDPPEDLGIVDAFSTEPNACLNSSVPLRVADDASPGPVNIPGDDASTNRRRTRRTQAGTAANNGCGTTDAVAPSMLLP